MGNFDDNPSYSHEWTSDSGATQHICGDLGWFGEYEEFEDSKSVVLTNNSPFKFEGKGTVILEALIQEKFVLKLL